jgi:NADH:ubiquinone oxidoreductase subunit 3 (subunit A)
MSLDACMKMTSEDANNVVSSSCVEDDQATPSSPYMHVRPIMIPLILQHNHHPDTDTVLPAILIFNQALAHHQLGMKDSRMLKKAAKLYECGFKLVMEENLWASSTYYVLACLNNLRILFLRMNQYETAKMCFEQLMSTLMFLVHTEHECSSRLNALYFNTVSCMIFPSAPPAPAA